MNTRYSRRSFFAFSRSALASVGLASWIAPLNAAATPTPALDDGVDYYDKLGVAKIINAAGVFTMFTSSTMPPPVQLAVAKAAKHPVRLKDLQLAAGAYIACPSEQRTCFSASFGGGLEL
jgi:L-seryl-tRNA(Ser) seleniumtransferase